MKDAVQKGTLSKTTQRLLAELLAPLACLQGLRIIQR